MLIEERSAALRVSQAPSGTALASARSRPHGALLLVGACVLIAALTLLLPSAPTYDPWAWIIWGREIAHFDLTTTGGPSWKPLPVAFTTVFSLFGSWSPDLWLVVARAGAIGACLLAFRVARSLGGGIVGGVAAACALAIAPWWIRSAALGNSEGLLVALVLGAVDREIAGNRRFAFWLAAGAGLLRPEVWPFLGLYGLFVMWTRAYSWKVVVGVGVLVLAVWTLPEWWGSGDLLRAAHRAKSVNAGAPTYADNPAREVLHDAGLMLTTPLIVGLLCCGVMVMFRKNRVMAVLIAGSIAWLGLVAYMTSDGFSGNQRYLMGPISVFMVLGGAGIGWALQLVVDLVARRIPAVRAVGRRPSAAVVVLASVVVGVAFAAPSFARFSTNLKSLKYQAQLADELPGLIRDAGGAAKLKACGAPVTGPFLVPVVAWNLRMHTKDVQLVPRAPTVVFRVKTNERSRPVPTLKDIGAAGTTLATGSRWRIVAACGRGRGA